ncbi:hypothetical protein RJ640_017390 [Escallonia rubra]|uniref:ER lumen protein-retaining receptor n=1 Tax=Escallonia rubra TaxID=112253 RepID=A0AA88R3G4_9ASTE|nr:hypothetical protein RJ640_017390 [Escallonia rubra]
MNIFRFAGDMTHLISILVLLLKIYATKSCSGISLKTQELYALVFVTRYLDLFTDFISVYNTVMKLVFIASSAAIVWWMRRHSVVKRSYDRELDTFRHHFLILACFVLALLLHEKFTLQEITGRIPWSSEEAIDFSAPSLLVLFLLTIVYCRDPFSSAIQAVIAQSLEIPKLVICIFSSQCLACGVYSLHDFSMLLRLLCNSLIGAKDTQDYPGNFLGIFDLLGGSGYSSPVGPATKKAYRALYILNWIYRYFTEQRFGRWICNRSLQCLVDTVFLFYGRKPNAISVFPFLFCSWKNNAELKLPA